MAFSNCDEEFCDELIRNGAFMIAPCGTIVDPDPDPVTGEIGKPDFAAFFDQFEFEDVTDIDLDYGREFNQKRTLRCRTRCSDTTDPTLSFSVCVCLDIPFHCALADPTSSCTFDWLWFPDPEDCDNPDVTTDKFFYGTSKGGFSNYGGSAEDTESLTLEVTTASCGRTIERCNFCDQTAVAGLTTEKATARSLNVDKAAA